MSDKQSASTNLDGILDIGEDINSLNKDGITPLIDAVIRNNEYAVEYLLNRGADVNKKSKYGTSPLDYAATPEIVELLVRAGADTESRMNGQTPLIKAVREGDTRIVNILLDAGANIEATVNNIINFNNLSHDNYNNFTPLRIAVKDGNYNMIKTLIRRGANMFFACERGFYEIISRLIDLGINVNYRDLQGRTALMITCMHADNRNYIDIVRLLLDKGANINIRDNAGYDVFDYISSGTEILSDNVKPFDRIGSGFRNEHIQEIIDMLIDKINNDVNTLEKMLRRKYDRKPNAQLNTTKRNISRNKELGKEEARTIALEFYDPRNLSDLSILRQKHRDIAKSKMEDKSKESHKSKEGGKSKSKRRMTVRTKR
jgi:ankyrin repeat protein